MLTNPLISVITVHYNAFEVTKEFLDSVLQSDYPHLEVIVTDNASTDNSFEKLKKNYVGEEKIKIVRAPVNNFVTGGINFGVKYAQGKIIVLTNNDITLEKNCLTELINCMKNEKYILQPKLLSYWNHSVIDRTAGRYIFPGFGLGIGDNTKDIGQFQTDRPADYVHGTVCMINKKFFERIGGLDNWYKAYYEDVDMCLRAKKYGGVPYYCHKSIAYHKGSWTYRYQELSATVIYHVRKNRLRTIVKNFSGLNRLFRVTLMIFIHLGLALKELINFRSEHFFLTLKSIYVAVNMTNNYDK